jgi:hypothetical protein
VGHRANTRKDFDKGQLFLASGQDVYELTVPNMFSKNGQLSTAEGRRSFENRMHYRKTCQKEHCRFLLQFL